MRVFAIQSELGDTPFKERPSLQNAIVSSEGSSILIVLVSLSKQKKLFSIFRLIPYFERLSSKFTPSKQNLLK